jgi:glycosyltransferase involved in cell wall biosynthesis
VIPTRITFVSSHAQRGGSERYLEILLAQLGSKSIHDVVILQRGPLVDRLRTAGFPTVEIPTAAGLVALLSSARRLRRRLRANPPELVHANGVKAALVSVLATRALKVPVVWVKHDFSWDGRLSSFIARRASLIVGVSAEVLKSLPSTAATKVVHTGITIPHISSPAARRLVEDLAGGSPVISLVGRLDPAKGHRDLLAAAPIGARLLFVGDVDENHLDYAEQLWTEASGRATFVGHRDDIEHVIAGSDAIAMPSRTEGFGLVALEAMALGVPVVGYATGAIPEVVGNCGVLVPLGDVEALRVALDRVLTDLPLKETVVSCGRARAANDFDVHRWVDEMRSAYRIAASPEPLPPRASHRHRVASMISRRAGSVADVEATKAEPRTQSAWVRLRGPKSLLALILLVVAAVWPLLEIGPRGATILAVTPGHGVDVGDLPALIPLTLALVLVFHRRP